MANLVVVVVVVVVVEEEEEGCVALHLLVHQYQEDPQLVWRPAM